MSSLNKVCLIGNLGKDPETKSFANGGQICLLSLATSERWRDKQSGEMQERTEWHNVVIRNENLIGIVERYLVKGAKVYLEGSLQTRKWQDQSGADRYTTEVVVGFNGTLVMLGDPGGAGGSRRDDGDGYGGGRNNGRGAGTGQGRLPAAGGGRRRSMDDGDGYGAPSNHRRPAAFDDDLNDDVPF